LEQEKVVAAAYHRTRDKELPSLKTSTGTGTSIWIDH